jgi:SSS family solute:Na+ symporter
MVGALAAFMSTMDSQLLALSSMLTRDAYVDLVHRDADVRRQVRVGKLMVVVLAAVGLAIALRPPDTIFAIATQAFTGLAVLFPTTIAVLYWRRVHPRSCVASIVTGQILVIAYHYDWLPEGAALGLLPVVPIVAVCTAIIVAGSLAAGSRNGQTAPH